jgi:cytochrome c oxidase subunit III
MDSTTAKRRREEGFSLGQLGMVLLFVSISVLFVAASLAVLITSYQAAQVWRAPDRSGLPWGTFASTLLLVIVSYTLQSALLAIRTNRFTHCIRYWRLGAGAATVFLFVQALNVRYLVTLEGAQSSRTLFVFCYDLLVGLHALHVLGGFVPLVLVHNRLVRRDYSSSRHTGLTFCVQYWHYLGIVWLVLLGVLSWAS